MAWNSSSNKSIDSGKSTALNPGAPVAYNPSQVGKPYRDSWDIERAYREGFQKVTWVNRCIDAIAGNQSRLPVVLRENNDPAGRIIRKSDKKILDILNTKSNMGENSFVFRYRLSSQLLMSSRGAFIEKIRGRDGELIALQLLPPQHTSPIPDPKKFVSGFEVDMRNGTKVTLKPEDVVWIRKPHPLDPYLSLTPMESAGIAIEIENLSKIYNRNFLLNDGRPGGLLVVRGEIDDDDKDELEEGMIEIAEGETLEDIKARLKPKKSAISIDMLDTANTYDDKVAVIRMLVSEDSKRVASVLKNMIKQ